MSEMEDELRRELCRKDPPSGFAERVLARAQPRRSEPWKWIAAGIAASLLMGAGAYERRQYEGRKAKQELLLALEITGSKLNIAQKKVFDLNQRRIHE